MICSHRKKFIYLKTRKTASTSVEIYFEKFCAPAQLYEERSARQELITNDGIIGFRAHKGEPLVFSGSFYHHMSAERTKELLGEKIWDSYFKFYTIRNPYDKCVSFFWTQMNDLERQQIKYASFEVVIKQFTQFITQHLFTSKIRDQNVFMIGKAVVVDDFIRYENLHDDVKTICKKLDIEFDSNALKRYRSDTRVRNEHFSEYYIPSLAKLVKSCFAWEIEHFNYGMT